MRWPLPAHVPPVPSPRAPDSVFGALSLSLINGTFGTFICLAILLFPLPASCLPLCFTGSFFKKCNLSVSEMPVLVKPPRTRALPSLTPRTSLFMTHQDLPGSPQATGTFTHSYQPPRA